MSHKSYRINTKINNGDKVLKVNLKQGIDTLKVLSLEINSEDTYQLHTSNYGVIVGRVLANDAFGVPNVKVSVFIPISDEDQDSYVVSNEYPYKTTQSTNNDGVKYNLLYDEAFTGLDGKHKSIGTFPNKRLVLDNDGEIEVFDKYWKYTTVTNESGDYMIFGVPTGTCQVHFDCDLSDIGIISQKPYDFVNKGYSASLFKSATEFNDDMADSAIQVMSQDKTIFVYPFWGDDNANEIGITRSDLNLDYKFEPSCIFMGSSITDSPGTYIGTYGMPNGNNGRFKSLATSAGDIEIIRYTPDGYIEEMKENVTGIIDGNGVWCYAIPMNLDRVGTDEEGNIVPISNPNKGIPTRARVRFRISLTDTMDQSSNEYTAKLLVPCNPKIGRNSNGTPMIDLTNDEYDSLYEFGSKTPDSCFRDLYWGKVYSVKQYYPRIQEGSRPIKQYERSGVNYADYPIQYASPFSCISSIDAIAGFNAFPYNTMYAGAENMNNEETSNWFTYHLIDNASNGDYTSKGLHFCFENDWVNGCLYFPRVKIVKSKNGTYQYFGSSSEGNEMYITGRHNLKYENGKYTIRDTGLIKWSRWNYYWFLTSIDTTSCFSYIIMSCGLLTRKTTMFGESVFYYNCGGNSKMDTNSDSEQFLRLYATDIILLGNISDIYDSIPKLFENLPSTTTIFPPIVIPKTLNESGMNMNCYQSQLDKMWDKDTEDVDIFGNFVRNVHSNGTKCDEQDWSYVDQYKKTGEANALYYASMDSSPKNDDGSVYYFHICRYAQERSALFFGYRVKKCADFLCYFRKSFPNLSRICELDVNNDSAFKSNPHNFIVPINGVIDRYDIVNDENRSNFASLNYDITRNVTNPITGYKRYVPTPMNIVDFEGRLDNYFTMYDTKMRDENADKSYIKFRYGDNGSGPRMYHPKTMPNQGDDYTNQEPLILTENSFYFYFGLHGGNSAIDVFRKKYYSDNIEVSNISDLITIEQYSYSYVQCNTDDTMYKTCTIKLDNNILLPFSYYIYANGELVEKNVISTTNNFEVNLQIGLNKIQIIDSKNRIVEKSQYIFGVALDIDYTLNADERTCTFKSINDSEITSIELSNENATLYVSTDASFFYLKFDTQFEKIGSAASKTIRFSGDSDVIRVSSYNVNSSCDIHNTLISFSSANSSVKNINNVPVEVLTPWISPINGKYQWNSYWTQISDPSLYTYTGDAIKKYSIQKKLEHISNMISSVYDGSNISINGASYDYTNIAIYPNYGAFSTDNISNIWNNAVEFNDKSSRVYSTLGSVNGGMELPSIVGQNYPVNLHSFSSFKLKKGGLYEDNKSLTVKNGDTSEFVGSIYLGLKGSNNNDLPSNSLSPSYNSNTLTSIENNSISNYFEIKTIDKRLDYEVVLLTPLILPSGYNIFNSLKMKSLNGGKIKAEIYGGLKFDHDANNKITCYDVDNTYYISGRPTSNATMFKQVVCEDLEDIDVLPGNISLNTENVWNINKNDELLFENTPDLLSGSTCISLNMIACSGDFSDWYVKAGKSISPTFSYGQGVELIHNQTSGADYDLLYEESSSGSSTYYASLSGSSLKFRLVGDSMFAGNTYTDIDTSSLKTDSSKPDGDSNSYPSWAQKYVDSYGALKTKELSVLRCDGTGLNVIKEYTVSRKILDIGKEKYPTLNYDKNKSFFSYHIDENGKTEILPDSDLSYVYNFEINSYNDKFGEYDYLIIPTRKVYKENAYTLLKQAMVYNTGCAFYASKLSINKNGNTITVQLFSPLLDGNGVLQTGADSLIDKNGMIHTVGNITNFYCDGGDVTYDNTTLSFKITTTKTNGIIPFYFVIENGLKYRVNINLGNG